MPRDVRLSRRRQNGDCRHGSSRPCSSCRSLSAATDRATFYPAKLRPVGRARRHPAVSRRRPPKWPQREPTEYPLSTNQRVVFRGPDDEFVRVAPDHWSFQTAQTRQPSWTALWSSSETRSLLWVVLRPACPTYMGYQNSVDHHTRASRIANEPKYNGIATRESPRRRGSRNPKKQVLRSPTRRRERARGSDLARRPSRAARYGSPGCRCSDRTGSWRPSPGPT